VNPPKEPLDLWTDDNALDACAIHWGRLANRFKGIPNEQMSFDLLNEPAAIPEERYVHVATRLVGAIREQDPTRLIIADGLKWGREPVKGLIGLGIAQSTRGYDPMQVSHYKASWVAGAENYPEPTWPLEIRPGNRWDKERLRKEKIEPWKALEHAGVGVHVGEWGAFNRTPHPVALNWMRDCLELWKEAGWGWALWNFRGAFGIVNSGRKDVSYEPCKGLQLDRKMLELLRAF
jgi:endoglucanase